MERLPPDTPGTSGIDKATPLLHDDSLEIDPELYAISGACGYPDKSINEQKTDIEFIVETLFSTWLQFSEREANVLDLTDSALLRQKAVHAMAIAWKQIKAKRKDLPESKVIIQGLAKSIINYMYQLEFMFPESEEFVEYVKIVVARYWQQVLDEVEKEDEQVKIVNMSERRQIIPERLRKQREMARVTKRYEAIVERLFLAWLQFPPRRANRFVHKDSAFLSPKALQAMSTVWKQIRAENKDPLESNLIVQGLAKSMVNHMYQLELMVPNDEKISKEAFTKHLKNIVARCWQQIVDETEKEDEQEQAVEIQESRQIIRERLRRKREIAHTNLRYEIIVKRLFAAWLEFPPRKANVSEHKDSAFLCPKAKNAMSTAWKQIKTETENLPESKVIVQGLAKSMVNYIYRLKLMVPCHEEEIKAFTERVESIVSRCWQQILEEIEKEEVKERKERLVKRRERRARYRERMRKEREIAYVNWFYEPFAKADYNGPVDCRICCILLCLCCSKFMMQILIHTTLLAWPISIGTMGGMYLNLCPMSNLMLYTMIAIGFAGTLAILTRLSFAMFENISGTEIKEWWPTILVKILEFVFFDFILIQLFCFYSKTPSFDHGSPNYCNETFYKFVHWINYVSIGVSSMWLFVYFIKGLLTWHLRKYSLRPW